MATMRIGMAVIVLIGSLMLWPVGGINAILMLLFCASTLDGLVAEFSLLD